MRKLISIILALIAIPAGAQYTPTPNIGLQLPAYGSTNWTVPLNYNFTLLDQLLSGNLPVPALTATYFNATIGYKINGSYGTNGQLLVSSGAGTTFTTLSSLLNSFAGSTNSGWVLTANGTGGYSFLPGGGSGSTVQVNGAVVASPNFNGTTPAAGSGFSQVLFQVSGPNVSAEVATPIVVQCGGTNDTAAIQAALGTGAVKVQLYAPGGTCQMAPTGPGLTIHSNTILDLGGATLAYSPTIATSILVNAASAEVPNRTITGCVAASGSTSLTCSLGSFTTADYLQSIDCLTAAGAGNNYDLHTSIVNITSGTVITLADAPGQNVNPATCSIIYRDTNITVQNGVMTLGGSLAALSSQPMIYVKTANNVTFQNLVMNEPGTAGAFHINVADATNVLEQNLTFFSTQLQQDGIDNIGPIRGVFARNIFCNTGDDCVDIATSFASSPVTGLNDQTIYGTVDGVEYGGIYGSATSANDAVKIFLNIPGNIFNVHAHDIVGGPYIYNAPTINSFAGFARGVDVLMQNEGLAGTVGKVSNINADHIGGTIRVAPVIVQNIGDTTGSVGDVYVSNIANSGPATAGEALVQVSLSPLIMTNLYLDMPLTALPNSELFLSTTSGSTITNLFTNNTTPTLYSLAGTITNTYTTPKIVGPVASGHSLVASGIGGNLVDSGGTGGGSTPGGSSGQTQYNNAGSLGGYTPSGDCAVVVSTGVFTCTKTGGVAFVASATTDTTNATNIGSGTLAHARLPALVSADIPNNAANTSGQANTAANLAGGALGNIPYQSAAATTALLAGNTAATDQVVVSAGTGSAAQAPTLKNAPALSAANMTSFPAFSVLGTVTTGVWNATKIAALFGGTGVDTSTVTGCPVVTSGTWTFPACSSGGTVTHTAGALTALHVMLGNGAADSKVDTVAASDGAGNLTLASVTTGSGSAACGSATGCYASVEAATAGTPTAASDYRRADTSHLYLTSLNGGAEFHDLGNYRTVSLSSTGDDGVAGILAPANEGSGTAAAGKYVDGGTGAWTTLPGGGGLPTSTAAGQTIYYPTSGSTTGAPTSAVGTDSTGTQAQLQNTLITPAGPSSPTTTTAIIAPGATSATVTSTTGYATNGNYWIENAGFSTGDIVNATVLNSTTFTLNSRSLCGASATSNITVGSHFVPITLMVVNTPTTICPIVVLQNSAVVMWGNTNQWNNGSVFGPNSVIINSPVTFDSNIVLNGITATGATNVSSVMHSTPPVTVTFSSTPALVATNGLQTITLTGNAVPTITGIAAGQRMTLQICQDATGGHTWAPPASMHGAISSATIAAMAVSTCAMQPFESISGTTLEATSPGVTGIAP